MFGGRNRHTVVACMFLLLGIAVYSQSVSFIARRDFAAGGTAPIFVSVYDVDGDGNLDVLVSTNQGLMLMRGNGAGELSPGENLLPGALNAVWPGDFNGDGITDLAVARNNGLILLYGDGKGGFREQSVLLPPQSTPIFSLAVDDFNADKYPDLVITNSNAQTVMLFRGLAKGGFDFDRPERFSVGNVPRFVTTADLNGDRYPDLVVANQNSGNVSVLLWNPSEDRFNTAQAFSTGVVNTQPSFIAAGDFNNDGHMDIAVSLFGTSSVALLFGDGTGRLSAPTPISVGQQPYVITDDFNSDGFLDLVVSNSTINGVSIFYGNSQGAFGAPRNFAVGSQPRVLATGDFNGDKMPDLVVANSGASTVTVLLGDGAGGFLTGEQSVGGQGPAYVAIADFNGDQRPDLAVVNRDSHTISILLANERGGFDAPSVIDSKRVGSSPITIAAGDMDGDKQMDLIVSYPSHIKIFFGDGQGGFPRSRSTFGVGIGITSMAVKDFNRDGKLDVALVSAPAAVTVLMGDGMGGFSDRMDYTLAAAPRFIIAEDFNGDNWPDLAVTHFAANPGSVSVLLGDGKGSFETDRPPISLGFGAVQPVSLVAGDFDGDNKLDLAVMNQGSSNVSILLGDGRGGFDVGSPPRRIATPSPGFAAVEDFNGDGRLDLAVVNRPLNSVSVFLGDGVGGFNLAGNFGLGIQGPATFITSLALNGDGKPDLLAVNYGGDSVSILINDSEP